MTNWDSFPVMYTDRIRHETTNIPRSSFNMHPCYRHTQTAMPASAVPCVSSLSPSCHLCRHSSASLIHVLPGPRAPLSSHTPSGSMQNQTMQTVTSIRTLTHPPTVMWCIYTQPFHLLASQGLWWAVRSYLVWHGLRAMWGDVWLVGFLGCNLSCPTSHNASGVYGNQSQQCTSSRLLL